MLFRLQNELLKSDNISLRFYTIKLDSREEKIMNIKKTAMIFIVVLLTLTLNYWLFFALLGYLYLALNLIRTSTWLWKRGERMGNGNYLLSI